MLKIAIHEKIQKTAQEMERLIDRSKRKLIELETLLAFEETRTGAFDEFVSARELVDKVR